MPTREEKLAFIQQKLAASQGAKPAAKTREEKIAFIQEKAANPSTGNGVLASIIQVGNAVDSVTGAPTRAAIGAAQDGKNPLSAAWNQFGADPGKAPTGQQIVKKAGVSDRPIYDTSDENFDQLMMTDPTVARDLGALRGITRSGVAGFAVDVAADPTNLIPGKLAAKGIQSASKGLGKTANVAGQVALQGVKTVPGAATIETTAKIVKEGAANTAEALKAMFRPTQASDYKELIAIARKNGIDEKLLPEAIEFGEGSFITRAARNRAEGVLGEPHLRKFHEGLEAVRDATEQKIAKIGGGSVPSPVEAGELIRQGYDEGVDRVFDSVGMTHNKVVTAIPGLGLTPEAAQKINSKLDGIEKWAKGRSVRGFTAAQRTQAEQVLRAINAVREGNGSYKQTLETLRDIGDVAFKTKNIAADIPPDVAKFRDLYFTINDALIDTVRVNAGAPVADELLESNKIITELMGDKSTIAPIVGNKSMSPERVFAALVEQGDTTKIKALKRILPAETFQRLKGAFLASQIRRTADDSFTFKSLQNNLRNKKNVLGEILTADEIREISGLIRLGDRFGSPVLSTSGTGASSLFSDFGKGIRSGLESDTVIGLMKDSARNRASKAVGGVSAKSSQPLLKNAAIGAASAAAEEVALDQAPRTLRSLAGPAARAGQVGATSARATSIQSRENKDRTPQSVPTKPLKGREKWMDDGLKNLEKHGMNPSQFKDEVLRSRKGQSLLISASDLKPGSKAMERIREQIMTEFGKGKK